MLGLLQPSRREVVDQSSHGVGLAMSRQRRAESGKKRARPHDQLVAVGMAGVGVDGAKAP